MDKTPQQAVTLIASGDQDVLCTAMFSTPPRLTPTGKISHAKTRVYAQRYRKDWEQMPEFKGWLSPVPFQPTRAFCSHCKKNLHAHRLSLLKHTCTMKHQRAALMHEQEKKEAKDGIPEVGEYENEEDIEYIVEKLDTDEEEESMREYKEEYKEDYKEDIETNEKREIDQDLCAQLQSDDENSEPVIKKIKLSEEKCRDPLAEAMAHVHNEYLEEVVDQNNVQMEMVIESTEADTSILSDSMNKKELLEDEKTVNHSETKEKILEGDSKDDPTSSEPILDTTYETNISPPTQNNLNFVPIVPNIMRNKTVTLMCGSKAFKLSGGQFQPGTQYVLTKLKGKPATLMPIADSKKITAATETKAKVSETFAPSTSSSQSPAVPSTSTPQSANTKTPLYKKTVTGRQSVKSSASKKLRISTYVVDTTKGVPIGGLQVSLYKLLDGKWTFLNESNTAADGHCMDLLEKINSTSGRYKLHFDVDKYFILRKIETMFPFVEIVFDVKNPNSHYHMPLLLSPFGYSTYRGT
ncbi:uncharacterized protein PF3D7_1120000-like isoform X2 [Linepithema humile]|uniref:uncharacterized protein PF3D7_1120000-like isoform X2 n=1 Tax=Linepithema humile TaxID=83485 RepID=UPI00062328DB|nr:PREDICTED: uncharacterized protein LOC105672884 isoform X2 [Linepithema humile]